MRPRQIDLDVLRFHALEVSVRPWHIEIVWGLCVAVFRTVLWLDLCIVETGSLASDSCGGIVTVCLNCLCNSYFLYFYSPSATEHFIPFFHHSGNPSEDFFISHLHLLLMCLKNNWQFRYITLFYWNIHLLFIFIFFIVPVKLWFVSIGRCSARHETLTWLAVYWSQPLRSGFWIFTRKFLLFMLILMTT